ncbi:hypothetical protein G7046_g3296 [Stylonectria norvegica]|nr:hypothetical protein G7046_g3296 [Stylonectria norvegica]
MPPTHILESPHPPSTDPKTILLETDRLVIRRYAVSDAPAMSKAGDDPLVTENLRDGFPSPYTLQAAEEFLEMVVKPKETAYPEHNGIFLKPNTKDNPSDQLVFIGAIGIIPKGDVYYRTWELGYWLGRSAWGKGYGTEAVAGFTRWVFATWPRLNRLEATAYSRNLGSANVLKKCGFVAEGRRRGAVEKGGVVMDELIFGLLRSDVDEA